MLLETHSFEFDGFLLNAKEKVLLNNGKPLSITPKAFQLLLALVEKHGRLIEKDALMKTVWADDFVEEGNLTFTIQLLRKILNDNAKHPRFIETVPKRGYRFIAEVKAINDENTSKNGTAQIPFQNSVHPSRFKKFLLPAGVVLIIGLIVTGFWYTRSRNPEMNAPVLSAPFALEKLSTNGKVHYAVISPDGKNVVYTNGIGRDKLSIWLRQLESNNNVEIIPPSDDVYGGLALSSDGVFLYFNRRPRNFDGQFDLYRVPIFGGVPQKIVSETQGWISLSPDGEKISFVRCYYREDENCSLWIADAANGKNERKLAARPRPFRIADNKFSPDGKTVAFAVGQSQNQANEFGLAEIDIESGAERELTAQKFFNIRNLAWLPDRSGLFITASRIPNKNTLIWQVSVANGTASPLTNDSETYSALSLDKNASVLVSTQIKQNFRLNLLNTENPASESRVLTDAVSVAFAPNGKIVFSSSMTGNDEIWSINADGSGQRQLTNNTASESMPVVSPDNNSILFASNRTGEVHVWRMKTDGSSQEQITKKTGGSPLSVSSDGKWLYYHHGLHRTLWRVATDGSEEQSIFDRRKHHFAVSPDGSRIGFSEKQGEENVLAIVSLADGQTIKTFKFAAPKSNLIKLVWSADGKYLAYILADGEYQNNTLWFQPLDRETPQQIADLGDEEISEGGGFALSPDGKSFAAAQGGWRHDAVLLKGLR